MSHERKDYIYIFKDWALPEKNARFAAGIFHITGGGRSLDPNRLKPLP